MSVSKACAVKLTVTELGVSSQLAYVNYLNAFHFMPRLLAFTNPVLEDDSHTHTFIFESADARAEGPRPAACWETVDHFELLGCYSML